MTASTDHRGDGQPPVNAPPGPTSQGERRGLLIAGVVFFGALAVLIGLVTLVSRDAGDQNTTATTQACAPDDAQCQAAQESAARPGIIPRPGEGRAPDEPGDRGGWEQGAVFGFVLAGLALIVVLVLRSARRNRNGSAGTAPPP